MLMRRLFLAGLIGIGLHTASVLEDKPDEPAPLIIHPLVSQTGYTGCSICESGVSADAELGHVFEGVEKRIELRFSVPEMDSFGLRAFSRETLDEVCAASKCTIIHHERRDCFDSYILSESSLFIFKDRLMIKTCGTTVPLGGVPAIIAAARRLGLVAVDMTYSRGSFLFPEKQLYPHNDIDEEFEYLRAFQIDEGSGVEGESCVLGSPESSYWLVHKKRFEEGSEDQMSMIMIDVIMTGLSKEARSRYFRDPALSDFENEDIMTASLSAIDPSFLIKGKCFDPCGYSCNAHGGLPSDERYFTVHITPEEGFSYASVEGVFDPSSAHDIQGFLGRVVDIFSPETVKVAILAPAGMSLPLLESPSESYGKTSEGLHRFDNENGSTAFSVVFRRTDKSFRI